MIATASLIQFFLETRADTERICQTLQTEDYVVQPIVDVSPPKWHLGHTTWFFEEFVLKPHFSGYKVFSEHFSFVFNSYYESVGKRVVRTDRGNLSRPTVDQVYAYRTYVTDAIKEFLETTTSEQIEALITIGIHHEKQHQELLHTDIKYILGNNPLLPEYEATYTSATLIKSEQWLDMEEGLYPIGHQGDGFCYDNELGRHQVYLQDYKIANQLVTNGQWLDFINDGGYEQVLLWHAEGWQWKNDNQIISPMYWHLIDGDWQVYTPKGLAPLNTHAPVCHISYFEAFAYAQWRGMRLPTEFEWEAANSRFSWGQRWEWTESAYLPYPNYTKAPGALGEYNGKFMVNQKVLRGGSVATPSHHTRPSYRNFFQTHLRWQFTGLRLAQ